MDDKDRRSALFFRNLMVNSVFWGMVIALPIRASVPPIFATLDKIISADRSRLERPSVSACAATVVPDGSAITTPEKFFFFDHARPTHRISPQTGDNLYLLEDDTYAHGTILTADPTLFNNAKGVALLLPGMGGNRKKYGAEKSGRQFILSFRSSKLGFFPAVFENPAYYGLGPANLSEQSRLKIATEMSSLPNQMDYLDWVMTQYFGGAVREEARLGLTRKRKGVHTRSNGTGLTLQWLSEAAHGNLQYLQTVRQLDYVMVAGLNSPEPENRARWIAAEDAMDIAHPESLDRIATTTDRALYAQMNWSTPGNVSHLVLPGFPPVYFLIAAQDEYVKIADQITVAETFAKNHPQIPVIIIKTDVPHDPLYGLGYFYRAPDTGEIKRINAGSADRVRYIMKNFIFDRTTPYTPGIVERRELEWYQYALRKISDEEAEAAGYLVSSNKAVK
jgi:hypothetical protein